MLLTAMSLKNAIDGINRYKGNFFFSVNIHPGICGFSGLVKMCAEACHQLKNVQWRNRLLLEYSEKSNFDKSHDILDTLRSISLLGLGLYLDG